MARLKKDNNGQVAQLFFIKEGGTLTSSYTPTEDMIISPVDTMTISVDGISKDYTSTSVFGLSKGVTYAVSGELTYHKA